MLSDSARISWRVGLRCGRDLLAGDYTGFRLLPNPWWGWCADPFLFEENGEVYVFAEIWNYFKQKGSIGYYQITGNGKDNKWHIIIEEGYHMSYPMIWKDTKGIHICAETCGTMDLHIYNCIVFPDKWEKGKTLINNKKIADTTFLFDDSGNPIWCFTYEITGINKGILLRYNVDSMVIDTKKAVIISKDAKVSRPGGFFVEYNGNQYRVAQDCSVCYGQNLCFLKIDKIDPYEETLSNIVSFGQFHIKNCIGIHTYNKICGYEVVDFRIRKFILANFIGTYIRFAARRVNSAIKRIKG